MRAAGSTDSLVIITHKQGDKSDPGPNLGISISKSQTAKTAELRFIYNGAQARTGCQSLSLNKAPGFGGCQVKLVGAIRACWHTQDSDTFMHYSVEKSNPLHLFPLTKTYYICRKKLSFSSPLLCFCVSLIVYYSITKEGCILWLYSTFADTLFQKLYIIPMVFIYIYIFRNI